MIKSKITKILSDIRVNKLLFGDRKPISLLNFKKIKNEKEELIGKSFKKQNFNNKQNLQFYCLKDIKQKKSKIDYNQFFQKRSFFSIQKKRHYYHYDDGFKKVTFFTIIFCIGTVAIFPLIFKQKKIYALRRNTDRLINLIILANGAVFLMWKIPLFHKYLYKYALVFKNKNNSCWGLLGSAFSHQSFLHLFMNMFALYSFGSSLCYVLGPSNFSILYLNSAVFSSYFSILISRISKSTLISSSLGASGSLFGIFGTFSYLFPKTAISLFFFPVPGGAWILFLGSMVYNSIGMVLKWGTYDYAAHLGGSLIGIAYGYWYKMSKKKKKYAINYI